MLKETNPETDRQPFATEVAMRPDFYYSEQVQAEEFDHIFSRGWVFVGFSEQVAEPGQFFTVEIAGTSVVIQNFAGEVRALHNVCSHRFARIQQEPCGNRSLTCPYHGWTYNKDGLPFIPGNAKFFQLSDEQRAARSLRRFELEACGRFLFVRLESGGVTLQEHLGDYAATLRHLSEIFVDKIDDHREQWSANWKFGVESVLEVYHVTMVHPETFKNFVQTRWEINVESNHNDGTAYLSEASAKWWAGVTRRLQLRPSEQLTNYDHFFIFPNLAIGLTQGNLMSVQTYLPTSPETCELHYRIMMAGSDLAPGKQAAVRQAVVSNVTDFNRAILREDREIIEQVQRGNRQMTMAPLHGSNEARIHQFHRCWHQSMKAAPVLTRAGK